MAQTGELLCPVVDCDHRVEVSEVDEDASMVEMISHFIRGHDVHDVQVQMTLLTQASVTA
jgi:hypothetical protein